MAKNVLGNPERASDLTAKLTTAALSKNSKTGSINNTRVDNILKHRKGSSPW